MDWALVTAAAAIALVLVTGALAFVTWQLTLATRRLADAAVAQGELLKIQAKATETLATTAGAQSAELHSQAKAMTDFAGVAGTQLDDFRAEARAATLPVLRWELRDSKIEIRPSGIVDADRLLIAKCRLVNYGPPAVLRPVLDVVENSLSWYVDPRRWTPPVMMPTGAVWDLEFTLGPTTARAYSNQHLIVKIDARPTRLVDEWRPVRCELRLFQEQDGSFTATVQSTSGWQP